jgi:hypothetical protein
MRRESAHGRDEEAMPVQEGLSTEDIAQTETEAPQQPARRHLTADPNAGKVASRTRTTDAAGDNPDPAADERDTSSHGPDAAPLLEPKQAEDLRFQWQVIQQGFVDDPQKSVRAADGLVAEVMQTLATTFADHKHGLEGQWVQIF